MKAACSSEMSSVNHTTKHHFYKTSFLIHLFINICCNLVVSILLDLNDIPQGDLMLFEWTFYPLTTLELEVIDETTDFAQM